MKNKKEDLLQKLITLAYIIIALIIVNILVTIVTRGTVRQQELYDKDFDISMFKTITATEIDELVNKEEKTLIIIGKPSCEYTVEMLPNLQKAQEEYNYQTYYIDQRTMTEEDQNIILNYDDETDFLTEYLGTTPLIIVFENGQMLDTWVGYQDYVTFQQFLEGIGYTKE